MNFLNGYIWQLGITEPDCFSDILIVLFQGLLSSNVIFLERVLDGMLHCFSGIKLWNFSRIFTNQRKYPFCIPLLYCWLNTPRVLYWSLLHIFYCFYHLISICFQETLLYCLFIVLLVCFKLFRYLFCRKAMRLPSAAAEQEGFLWVSSFTDSAVMFDG